MCGSQFTVEMSWIATFQLLFAFDNIALSISTFGPGFKCILCSRAGSLDCDVSIAFCKTIYLPHNVDDDASESSPQAELGFNLPMQPDKSDKVGFWYLDDSNT